MRSRLDLYAVVGAAALVVLAVVVGALVKDSLYAGAAPLFGRWLPHVGPGTPAAVVVALLVVVWGPSVTHRLSWRWALVAAYFTAVAWILALALVDGWDEGFAGRLTTEDEYLHEVPGITDVPAMVRGFALLPRLLLRASFFSLMRRVSGISLRSVFPSTRQILRLIDS